MLAPSPRWDKSLRLQRSLNAIFTEGLSPKDEWISVEIHGYMNQFKSNDWVSSSYVHVQVFLHHTSILQNPVF